MRAADKNTAMVVSGVGASIGGMVVMFLYDMLLGFILAIVGIVIGCLGALMFKPS